MWTLPRSFSPSPFFPIAAHDVAEIVVLAPEVGHRVVDDAGPLVEDRLRVAVSADRRVHRLPDVPLPAGPPVGPQHQLEVVHVGDGRLDVAEVVSVAGTGDLLPASLVVVGVGVLVDVDLRVLLEVDRVGAGGEAAVELLGTSPGPERFPPSGGPAVHEPRPSLPDAAELLLDVGQQLVDDGIAVRTEVLRVHRVGVVVGTGSRAGSESGGSAGSPDRSSPCRTGAGVPAASGCSQAS